MSGPRGRDSFQEAAVSSTNLSGRIDANKRFAGADFEAWMRGLVADLDTTRVLDICCGTGNQLVLYADKPDCAHLAGLDRSPQSLDAARQRVADTTFAGALDLCAGDMDATFDQPGIAGTAYDLISCCYGLYYARDVAALLDNALRHLTAHGRLMIVGPWGANNQNLFDILCRHVTLPELVVRSATSFMSDEIVPHLSAQAPVVSETFVNPVADPDVDAVLAYWRRTTFYDADAEDAVRADLEARFAETGSFIVEKHVMAVIAGS
jgi:ubiquinone/menaquinone biosynthesis C-methylase UbiE